MDESIAQEFRQRLERMLQSLETEASTTVVGMRSSEGVFPDPSDRAVLESERNLTLRIRDRERKLQKKIEEALQRVEENIFGLCEACAGPIGVKRLRARPVTTLCVNCKEQEEKIEKIG